MSGQVGRVYEAIGGPTYRAPGDASTGQRPWRAGRSRPPSLIVQGPATRTAFRRGPKVA